MRSALQSNATFSRLAEKLDVFAVSGPVLNALTERTTGKGVRVPRKSRAQIKATADLFETVIAAYVMETRFEDLRRWVEGFYGPLISAGKRVYENQYVAFVDTSPAFFELDTASIANRGTADVAYMSLIARRTTQGLLASHIYDTVP